MFHKKSDTSDQRGFVSLLAVMLVLAAVGVLALTWSTSSVSELEHGYFENRAQVGRLQAEACLEEGLYRVKLDNAFTGGIFTVASTTCAVVVTGGGGERVLTATSTVDQFVGRVGARVSVDGRRVQLLEWISYDGF